MTTHANPFALLGDESHPSPSQSTTTTTGTLNQQVAAVTKSTISASSSASQKQQQNQQQRYIPGLDKPQPQSKSVKKPIELAVGSTGPIPVPGAEKHFSSSSSGGNGGSNGGRGKHPRRGQRGGWHGHGRQMDRQSAMGAYKESERKVKQSWGDAGEPVIGGEGEGDIVQVTGGEEGEKGQVEKVAVEKIVEEREVEVPVKTFEEYLAERAASQRPAKPKQIRVANEGVDESKWKDAVPLSAVAPVQEDLYFKSTTKKNSNKEGAAVAKDGAAKSQKQFVDIDIRFNKPAVSGGSRSSRDGGDGGRDGAGRGGKSSFRGGRNSAGGASSSSNAGTGTGGSRRSSGNKTSSGGRTPNLNDTSAFPILAK